MYGIAVVGLTAGGGGGGVGAGFFYERFHTCLPTTFSAPQKVYLSY